MNNSKSIIENFNFHTIQKSSTNKCESWASARGILCVLVMLVTESCSACEDLL